MAAPFQPSFPINIAAYYLWYNAAKWVDEGGTTYTPSLGTYTSADPTIIGDKDLLDWHISFAKYAHLNAFASSWWGPGDITDTNLPLLMTKIENSVEYPELRVCVIYEMESVGDPSRSKLLSDLKYLDANYFSRDSYLKVDGVPVVFVFSGASNAFVSIRWHYACHMFGKPLYLLLQLYGGFENDPYNVAPHTDTSTSTWWQYNPQLRTDFSSNPVSYSVSAGFDRADSPEVLSRDLTSFTAGVASAIASAANWHLFYFNEWIEGSQIEPTVEDTPDQAFLDVLAAALPAVP